MAQCFELTLLSGTNADDFERFLWKEVFPKFEILRRNVRGTTHRLLKLVGADSPPRYIWLVFTDLVGSTPETAGQGPEVLASNIDWLSAAAQLVANFATISTFTEVRSPETGSTP
jgi:hypothetical protein